jgi:hypothetical protein
MSKKSMFDIDDSMRQVKGTLAIEGFELDRKAENNFQIDWSYTTADEMIGSSIQSLVKNDNGLKQIFLKCIRN